jgi:hypothetical protein
MKKLSLYIFLVLMVCNMALAQSCVGKYGSFFSPPWTNCYGKATFDGGSYYEGEFYNEKAHGQGTYKFSNGDIVTGEFYDGLPEGHATLIKPDGAKYVGQFRGGRMHGEGTYTLPNGTKYFGEWNNDEMHGQGTYTFPNGNKYVGIFKNGERYEGTTTFTNGGKYIGQYEYNKKHGQGTYKYSNGNIEHGVWEKGKFIRGSRYVIKDKVRWEGTLSADGLFEGNVKLFYDDGSIQEANCEKNGECSNYVWIKTTSDISSEKEKDKLYEKIYNECILENLKGQTDKETIKIVKDACKNKAENPSFFDKLFN